MERKIDQIKKLRPHYARLSDDQIVDLVRDADYPDRPREEIAQALGVQVAAPAEQPLPERNTFGYVNDQVINAANAAAGVVKAGVDLVAPDSAASRGISGFIQSGKEKQSDKQKALDQQLAQKLQAEGDSELGKAGAYLGHMITSDPSKLVSEAAGNIGPFAALGAAGQAARLGGAAKTALTMGVAGAVGGGSVRGSIFEKIDQTPDADLLIESPEYYDLRVNQGLGEKEAKSKIGADLSRNLPEVGAGFAAGAIGGKFGVEGMAARVAPNMGRMTAMGVGLLDEGAQGAIEQVSTNYGVQRAMPAQSLTEDVALNAAAEALPGGVAGLALGGGRPRLPDAGPLSRGVNAGLDAEDKQAAEAQALAQQGLAPIGITEGQYNQGMDAIMAQGDADAKALKLAGMLDKTPGARPVPVAASTAEDIGVAPLEAGQVGEVDALADRIMVTRASLADEQTRELIREKLGDQALREAMYYVQQADMAQDIPDITRDRMLGVAEEIVSRARLTPIPAAPALGTDAGPALDALEAPAGVPQIGLDTTPTGAFRADERGNVFPETEADRINTRQATQARQVSAGDERQGRKASAVFADEAPRQPGKPKAIGYDTTPTGRMIAGETGVMVETQAERIKREQARKVQPGDKLNPSGNPFKNIAAARTEQRRTGGAVVEVEGGWVVRPQAEDTNGRTGETPRVPEQLGAGGAPDAIASVGSDGRGVADGGNAVADRSGVGAGVPGDARGGQRAVPDRATGRERSDALTEVKKTPVRFFGSTGYQLTMADAVKKVAELEKDAREAKKRASSAQTKIMQKIEDDASSRAASLARQLRTDIKVLADGYPDARQELEEAKQVKSDADVAQPKGQDAGLRKTPNFLKTKTVPEMTDDELRQAAEFYGPEHKRAKTIEKEMGKRAPKQEEKSPAPTQKVDQFAKESLESLSQEFNRRKRSGEDVDYKEYQRRQNEAVQRMISQNAQAIADELMAGVDAAGIRSLQRDAENGRPLNLASVVNQAKVEYAGSIMVNSDVQSAVRDRLPAATNKKQAPVAKPKTMQDMAQDLAQAIKQGGWDAYTSLRSKLSADANLNVRQTLDLNGLTRSVVGVEFFDTEYAKADPEKAGRSAHARGEAPIPPEGLSEDQKARWLAAWDEGKARKDEQEPVKNDRPGEVVGEATEVKEPKALPTPKKAEMRPYRRSDGSIGYEAVPIVESADQGQQDDLAADPEMAAYERGQTAETRAADRKKVVEAVKPSENKVFTEDAYAKAREILRKKLGQLNSGLDPEIMQAGITLAGYHIEKGARTFAAYAQAMISDLGDSVRPYLKSWYMGVKYDPRASGFDGMSTAAEVESASVDAPTNAPVDQAAEPAQTADETTSENQDERRNLRGESPQALDEVAAEDDGGPQGIGQTERSPANSGQERPSDGAGVDAAGVSADRGRGSRAGAVRVPQARAGRGADGMGDAGVGRARKSVPRADGRAQRPESAKPAVTPAAPNVPAQNFRITPDLRLGQGGEVEKFNDNMGAIRTLKALEAERRRATADEQRALARYVGWGGLANAFADPMTGQFKDKWKARGEELQALLTPQEYAAARRSTRNAHYTSEVVVSAMWDAARRLGFRGGLVLEDSMGTGNFLGLKPEDLPGKFIGVEYDGLTSRIAQALYPQAAVLNSGFQKVPVADNAFALNIGNPPFGSESLRFQFKPELQGVSIHNQFFRAGLDAVRPGGLQIKVVSRFLMDAQDKSTRVALARQADLVAAIRLPDTAFKENARTEVVTDIIILRKLTPAEQAERQSVIDNYLMPDAAKGKDKGLASQAPAWIDVDKVRDPLGGEAMTVNRYFAQNPAQIMGVLERSGSMQHGADITVRLDDPKKLGDMLRAAVDRLPANVSNIPDEVIAATEDRFSLLADALRIAVANEEVGHMKFDDGGVLVRVIEREAPDGGYIMSRQQITEDSPWSEQLSLDDQGRWYKLEVEMGEDGKPVKATDKDGKVTRRNVYKRTTYANEADVPSSMRLGKAGFERLQSLVNLRDLLKQQLVLETEDAKASIMEGNRKKLASAYADYVAKHGPVNRSTNMALAMTMPDGGLVTALEVSYQPERSKAQAARSGLDVQSEKATPAPILRERVVPKYEPPTNAATAADALAITLAERGRVDIDRIAALRGTTPEAAVAELQAGDKPLVFRDPESETWETADAYLSGMVRRKLNAAREMASRDPKFEANVKALEAVQPEPWTAENVTAQMGAAWVPGDVYAEFITSLVGGKASVSFSAATNSFTVNARESDRVKVDQWSTDGAPADYIINRLLNSQAVVVTYKDENGSVKVDQERTALAQLKGKEIVSEFGDWVFKDGDRRQRLVDLFNEKFNTRVNRQFDGSHLKLPGKVPDSIIQMRRHQKNAIWRGIASRFLLLDHVVGAGKTFTGIARAMERRRMGLARKPMIVVPNHLVEQWAADVYRLYPGAKVLAAGQKDFEAKRRRRLFGKIATGDWDIVIAPHSSFGFIGISPETEMRYLELEMQQAKDAIKEAEAQAEEEGRSGFRKPFGVKEAERLAEKIQARIDKLQSGTRDRLLTFEQLGVDDLTVDEAHEFKNLFYSSRLTGVRGMGDKTGSRKAADLYNKVRVMRENGGAVTFMTGTPISNSAVEMYTMMRYLAADELQEQGLEHFDAWRAQSVEASAAFEPTESGRLKEVTRLGRTWANMRALMDTYYGFTDAVSIEDIKKWFAEDNAGKPFPVPQVKGGDRALVKVKPTPAQEGALKDIISGFDGLDGIKDPTERNAERLRLMDRARKVSLDIRAVDPRATSQEDGGKLQRVSSEIKRIYDKWTPDRGTQLVFLDRSVPKAKGDDKIVKEYDELVAKRDKALKDGNEEAFQSVFDALEKFDANEVAELRNAQTSGWNAYQQIKDNLVAAGIPAAEIRFVQEAQNDEQKAALFDAVRGGKVRVLIGSTPRMGAGTNVQDRLVGLHHVDVTWKPSDIEQREGRIIRQGNKLLEQYGPDGFEVEIMAYATERTVDAKMWDLNAQKLRMINGIRKYDGAFSMEFEDEESVSMAEMAALASGNPLLLERVTIESQIGNLELQERAHRRKMYGVMDAIQSAERALRENPEKIRRESERGELLAGRVAAVEEAHAGRKVDVEGQTFTETAEAMRAALAAVEAQQEGNATARYAVNIEGKRVTSKEAINDAIGAALGDAQAFVAKVGGAEYAQRTAAGRELARIVSEAKTSLSEPKTVQLGEMFGFKLVADLESASSARGDRTTSVDVHLLDGERTIATSQASVEGIIQMTTAQGRKLLEQLESDVRRRADYKTSVRYYQGQMERAESELPALRERRKEEFPKAKELSEKRRRLEEVVRELSSAAEPSADAKPDDAAFSRQSEGFRRASSAAASAKKAEVQEIVDRLTASWKNAPDIIVLGTFDEAPESVKALNARQVAGGASGVPEAFVSGGKAYIVADQMPNESAVAKAVFHEVLGHRGLRGVYGAELGAILDQIRKARARDVFLMAGRYGMDTDSERDMRAAAEEVLAGFAEKSPQLGFVRRAVAAVRSWLRRNVSMLSKMRMTDDEIINDFIIPARRFITEGPGGPRGGMIPAFKREKDAMSREAMAAKMDVDGKMRPTTNSSGQQIAATQDGVRNFWRWFGESKAVDAEGRPLVVYHGTQSPEDFGQFRDGGAIFFAESAEYAANWASVRDAETGMATNARVMPAYVRAESPKDMTDGLDTFNPETDPQVAFYDLTDEETGKVEHKGADAINALKADGHDSAVWSERPGERNWVVFGAGQIKSAIGNTGTFSADSDEIAFSRSAAAGQYTAQAREAFMDFVGNAGAQVDWLDRTFKTQYAKAQKFPAFGRVFNKLQEYIEGVSTLANQAADNAPSILPKLETWRDLAKTGLSEADAKAVAEPIFQGTLEWVRKDGKLVRVDDVVAQADGMTADQKARQLFKDGKVTEQQLKTWKASPLDIYEGAVRNRYESEYLTGGVVFSTPELKSMFGLTDAQIGQYSEFRAAINDSLDQLVAADVLRLIGNVPDGMKAMALDPQGRKGLRQAVEELLADEDPALWNKVSDKFNQVGRLKERGYAPLSRFGKFWVHVVDDQGQTQYFGMAETRSEANQLARALRAEFPQGTVEQGVMSQEFHKLMSAVPIDAMELFAEAIGADESEVFQKYIQLAKNNRSTMKRLMKRKGTSGFSQDVGRVLASFVTSNARAASTALHIKDAKDMARDIAAGDVKDEAIKLIESVTEPEESGAGIRSLMFTNFIGGSIASAVVNATQPFMMTLPYLSQWGGAATAGRRMLEAMRMLSGKVAQDPDLAQALKRAEDDGIVSPQEIHHLINRAAGGVGSRFPVLQKVAFVWAAPFSLAEQFNRRISFVAAYLTAKEQGIKNPFAFAEKAVIETQGLYNAGNKPNVSRGVIGATAMTFKQYSIHYLEWLARMAKSGPDGKRAALLALALLMLAAGTDGLPFMEDLDDVLDTAGQAMGYDMNTERARREFISSILGEEMGEVATRGLSAAAGFPVDLSLRMGMGNLLPATDLLLKSNTDTARSLAEIAGPGGSMFIQYRDAAKMVLNGDPLDGARKALPLAGQNLTKGIEMAQEGEYRDSLGRRVMETTPLEAGMKALSFQPATVARESARMQESRQSENLAKQVENEIVDKWARAIADRDRDAEKEALKMRDEWNAKNPDMRIVVKRSQAIRKARNLKMDRRERYIKTVAPERRDSVDKEMG